MTELWKPIEGHEGYDISSHGRVRSFWKQGRYPSILLESKIMTPKRTLNGYLYVTLRTDRKNYSISRLVAKHFIPNPLNFQEVDHIDRDKTNNIMENLRWCDRSINAFNKSLSEKNTTGVCGVSMTSLGKWRARIKKNGVEVSKTFDTKEEAITGRKKLEEDFFSLKK